jgi:hypothetical protein
MLNCQDTFHNDAAQGHPFAEAIVADSGLSLGWKLSELFQNGQCYAISFGHHRELTGALTVLKTSNDCQMERE